MTSALSSQKCESCAGLPPLTAEEVIALIKNPEVEGWVFAGDGQTSRINRTFQFEATDNKGWNKAWEKSAEFVRKMLDLMTEENHHAAYTHVPAKKGGSVSVILVTHAVKGLSKNDFRMAAKLNRLYDYEQRRKEQAAFSMKR